MCALTVFSEDHQKDPHYKKRGLKRKSCEDDDSESRVNKENEPVLVPGKQVEVISSFYIHGGMIIIFNIK